MSYSPTRFEIAAVQVVGTGGILATWISNPQRPYQFWVPFVIAAACAIRLLFLRCPDCRASVLYRKRTGVFRSTPPISIFTFTGKCENCGHQFV